MSLLLDALQRASKDKEKAAAAADAAALPTLPAPLEPSKAERVAVPPARATPAPEYPLLSDPEEQAHRAPPSAPPVAPDAMELTLEVQPDPTPPKPAPLPPEPRREPKLDPMPAPEPRVETLRHATAPSPSTPVDRPAPVQAPSSSSTAEEPSSTKSAAVPTERAAQEIRRAYASQKPQAVSRSRRVLAWGVLAGVLSLAVASVFLGMWGDPSALLRMAGVSPAVPGFQLPPTLPETLPPATLPSAPVTATEAIATQGVVSAPKGVEVPPPPTLATTEPGPEMTAPRSRSAPVPRDTEVDAQPAKPTFAARPGEPNPLELGYAALVQGRFEDATQAYERSLKANPDEPDALLGLAYINHQQGRLDDARSYYRKVLRHEPGNAIASSGLLALDMDGDATRSAGRARDLASKRPDSAAAMAAAGNAFVRDGLLADAAVAFSRAQALEPSNPLHAYNHAVALDRLGQLDKAVIQYEKALSLYPSAGGGSRGYTADAVRLRIEQLRHALDKQNGLEE